MPSTGMPAIFEPLQPGIVVQETDSQDAEVRTG